MPKCRITIIAMAASICATFWPSLSHAIQPVNDLCSNATEVGDGSFFGSNLRAATDESAACYASSADVWWCYTAPRTGTATVTTCGSSFDTILSVYDSCGGTELACNGNAPGGACGLASTITFGVVRNEDYLIRVAGWNGAMGDIALRVASTPPANDSCLDATRIGDGTVFGSNYNAATDGTASCRGSGADVWWRYAALRTGIATVTTCGSSFDTILSVYDFCGGGELACNGNAPGAACGLASTVTFPVAKGAEYFIRVAGWNSGMGDITLRASSVPPTNDFCAEATPIEDGVFTGSNFNATTDGTASCYRGDADVWWRFTTPRTGTATVTTCGSSFDTILSVYDSCGGGELACNGNAPGGSCGLASRVTFTVIGGSGYWIRVAGWNGAMGDINLDVVWGQPPVNDLCIGATPIGEGTFTGSNVNAATDGAASCYRSDADVWWRFTTPRTGTATVTTCGSSFDTVLSVYDSCGGGELACNGNAPGGSCGLASAVTFPATAGVPYWIRVAGWDGDSGGISLATFVEERPVSDCNDNGVDDAVDIAVGTSKDCQPNSIPDECDIADGISQDLDGDGVPDECEFANPDGVPVGDLFITGGVINQVGGSAWRISGNVRINNLLRVTETVTANTATFTVSGDGEVWIDDVPGLGSVKIYEGAWELDGTTAATTTINAALSLLDMFGLEVRVGSISLVGETVRLQGHISLPQEFGDATIDIEGDHFIEISKAGGLHYDISIEDIDLHLFLGGLTFTAVNAGVHLSNVGPEELCISGTFSIDELAGLTVELNLCIIDGSIVLDDTCIWIPDRITVAPHLYVEQVTLCLDTPTNSYSGGGTFGIPLGQDGIEIEKAKSIVEGCFDSISLAVTDINQAILYTPTPIPIPIVYLERVGGSLDGLCPNDDNALVIGIHGAFTVGPEVEIGGDDWSLIWLDLGGELDLSGRVTGTALLKVGNQADPIMEGDARVIFDLADGVYLELHLEKSWDSQPFLDLRGQAAADFSATFQTGLSGLITIPDNLPFISLAAGQEILAKAYGEAVFQNDNPNGYMAVGFRMMIGFPPPFGPLDLAHAIEINLANGNIDWNSSWDRIREVCFGCSYLLQEDTTRSARKPPTYLRPQPLLNEPIRRMSQLGPEPFIVDPGVGLVIFRATWETGNTELELIDPSGTSMTPSNVGEHANAIYYENLVVPEAFYIITSPAAGQWQLSLSDPAGIGAYTLSQIQESHAPTITLTEPSADAFGSPITIRWSAADADSDAEINLFYAVGHHGTDGRLIVSGLLENTDTEYVWTPTGVQSGEYYVYAVIDDGMNVPTVSCSTGRVHVVNPDAPAAPTGLAAVTGTTDEAPDAWDRIRLAWEASISPDVGHYTVYYTADPGGEGYENGIGAGASITTIIEGLTPGRQYRFAVAAVDVNGDVSQKSDPIVVTVADPQNNNPVFTGGIASHAIVGELYQSQVLAIDIDGDAIGYAIVEIVDETELPPQGVALTAEGVIEWTPTVDQVGGHVFKVSLDDGSSGTSQRSFTVYVADPNVDNHPPEILSQAAVLADPATQYSYQLVVDDPDAGDTLTLELLDAPTGATVNGSGLFEYGVPAGSERYEFLVRVADGAGLYDIQRFTIQADATAPALNASDWGTATALAPGTIQVEASPVPDATGLVEFQLETDGVPDGAWQRSPTWTVSGLPSNTQHAFRIKARDAAADQNTTAWSDPLSRYTLADVPSTPTLDSTEEAALNVTLSAGANPPTTQLALWNASDSGWVGLGGFPAADEVWADAATWGTVRVQGLAFDTTYHFQVKARNDAGIETGLSEVLAAKTLAPDSRAELNPPEAILLANAIESTERQVTLTASFQNDPYANTAYSYTWVALAHPDTGKTVLLISGGGPDDSGATYAAPEFPAGSNLPYEVRCTVTGTDTGNHVTGAGQVTIMKLGDADGDFLVDLNDHGEFQECLTSPGGDVPAGCGALQVFDFDGDNNVDLLDWSYFQTIFTGP